MQKTRRTKLLSHARETGPRSVIQPNNTQMMLVLLQFAVILPLLQSGFSMIQYGMISQKADLNLLPAAGVAGIRPQC